MMAPSGGLSACGTSGGKGVSAFTLRLCVELLDQGLRPIRIRLRDLFLDRPLLEALPRALRTSQRPASAPATKSDDPFLDGRIFKELVPFGNARICPYVLIFDGWDEIDISANEGFRQRVTAMLESMRNEFLRTHDDRLIRVAAVHALGQIGSRAQGAIPALEPILKEDNAALRWCVFVVGSGQFRSVDHQLGGDDNSSVGCFDVNKVAIGQPHQGANVSRYGHLAFVLDFHDRHKRLQVNSGSRKIRLLTEA